MADANAFWIQVIRYTALGVGIFYGFYHQSKLQSREKIRQAETEYHRKEKLIMQAKAEWAKKNQPKTSGSRMCYVLFPSDCHFVMGNGRLMCLFFLSYHRP